MTKKSEHLGVQYTIFTVQHLTIWHINFLNSLVSYPGYHQPNSAVNKAFEVLAVEVLYTIS